MIGDRSSRIALVAICIPLLSSCIGSQEEAINLGQGWYQIDPAGPRVRTELISYEYRVGKYGMAIQDFVHHKNQNDYSYSFDAIGTGYAKYDSTSVKVVSIQEGENEVAFELVTGKTRKIDRVYRQSSILEIEYLEMDALWIEDKLEVPGNSADLIFAMRGMPDVEGFAEGKRLWEAAEQECGHNFGDCFIRSNGSEPDLCEYKGYFVYGLLNRRTGHGIGFVYPTSLTVHDWKIWWDEPNKVAIEFFPQGEIGKRWIFPLTGGKDELLKKGIEIIEAYGIHSKGYP